MPTYEYRCKDCGHQFDAAQSFTDDPLTECPSCHGALRKVFGNVGITFKGSGFYKTDSRVMAKSGASGSSESKSSDSGSDSGGSSGSNGSSGDGGPKGASADAGSKQGSSAKSDSAKSDSAGSSGGSSGSKRNGSGSASKSD